MTKRGPFLFIVGLLLLAGIATALFRHSEYRVPYLPGAAQAVWQIEARVEFEADGGNTQVALTLPPEQSDYRLIGESTASAGYGLTWEQRKNQRLARWSKREAEGEQILFYKIEAIADEGFQVPQTEPLGSPSVVWEEPYRTAAQTVLDAVLPQTADGYTLARQLLLRMNTEPLDQNMSLLLQEWRAARLLPRMLRTAGVHARFVSALDLKDQRRRQSLRELVQVWDGTQWRLIDPEGPNSSKQNLLLWQTGAPGVLEVIGGSESRVTFSMIRQTRSALSLVDEGNNSPLVSLYSLPVEEQSMFKLIMLLPVGAFVVVLMRILVGFRTSGTFMPVLIALSFLQTELLPGLVSFLLVIAVGLIIRSYLSALNLLLVARIATLVIVVIGIISVFSILSYELELISGGLTITFFPMIILAWTIERMSILWEEEGPKEVLIQGGGSLFVAVLAYLLMTVPLIQHLAFNFPELHLCLLALILLVGRYTGYRLTELTRFTGMPH